ncbi:TPA: hypothetical protein ACRR7A_005232 [Klebsiella quasipneumoniae]
MTVSINQMLPREIEYPTLGVAIADGQETVAVNYTVMNISNFDGENVTARFQVEIGGIQGRFPHEFTFKYSGSGNPLDEAESALAASLE